MFSRIIFQTFDNERLLGWRSVFTSGLFKDLVKFLDEFSKDQRLHISAQNIKQFPVAQLELFAHFF